MGAAKLTQSTKAVNLLKDDRYSSGVVTITTSDATLSAIDWEKTLEAFEETGNTLYELKQLDGNTVAICYKDSKITSAGTVKIPVYLTGNLSAKPNATISVSVKLV